MTGGRAAAKVLRQLARPGSAADRHRARLISVGVAGSGSFLLAAVAILGLRGDYDDAVIGSEAFNPAGQLVRRPSGGLVNLAPYLSQQGLRGGTAFGAVLLMVPFVLFALQAVRTGTAARERRLAALSLAGATRPQLRRLAFLEGTRAALIGAVLAGPAYLVLWLLFGLALPDGSKMLPPPGSAVLIAWPILIIALALAGGLAARMSARPAAVSPLGITRRAPRGLRSTDAVVPVVSLVVIAVTLAGLFDAASIWWPVTIASGAAVLAVTGGPWLILLTGRIAVRKGLLSTMAGRRLIADVRSPGRVVGVLLVVGIALGVIVSQVAQLLFDRDYGATDYRFYLGGFGAAAVGALLACLVASSSMVVGVTEQVLEGRRGNAVLVALAASPRFIFSVVRRQLMLVAVPATALGAALGWLTVGRLAGAGQQPVAVWLSLPLAIVIAGGAAGLGAGLAALAVRPTIMATSTPDNLRMP